MPKINIAVNAAGYGSVEIDGERVKKLRGFDVHAVAGELVDVTLHFIPVGGGLTLESNGCVHLDKDLNDYLVGTGWTPPAPIPDHPDAEEWSIETGQPIKP